ncbi:MAG: hypothetical protein ACYC3K_13370 [Candidatus Nanopelagicales bacterium]
MTNGTGDPGQDGVIRPDLPPATASPTRTRSAALALGAWLMPVTAHRPRSGPEQAIQARAGIVGITCLATAATAMGAAGWWVAVHPEELAAQWQPMPGSLLSAVLLVALSVFAPRPVFRTRSEALTRSVLGNPTAPVRTWRSTTITFTMVPVGALIAGIFYDPATMALLAGAAFTIRFLAISRTGLSRDPNARYHGLVATWGSAAVAAAAFAIVSPLSSAVSVEGSIVPLLLAAVCSTYLGLAVSSVDRWVEHDRTQWLLLRDALDSRRIIVAFVGALIAWSVAFAGTTASQAFPDQAVLPGALAGLGMFLVALLALWFVSIRMWVHESMRALGMWAAHQSEVMARIADGSLSPELAARASVPVTARMAISVFGATRAMVVLDDARGHVGTHLAAVDAYPHGPKPDARDLAEPGTLRLPLYPVPGHPNASSVTVGRWLWAGWFITRSRRIVGTFTDLATSALLVPVIASFDDRDEAAFDVMFDGISRWPTLAAFTQAVERMQRRADASPHTDSLLIGVYSIDDFGAIAGGRFEQAAVAQVMRLALGHQQFAGHDMFAAYEAPGRIWIALGGGPIIRNGIGLLRGLQEHVNDHGSVPSAKLDVDVHVSVSFGYAAHQVDEFTQDGLMAAALHRLAIDQGSRDPFTVDNLIAYDIRPEDIMGELDTPVTAVDTLKTMRADAGRPDAFPARYAPLTDCVTGEVAAMVVETGWRTSFGSLDLTDPEAFLSLVGRQPQLAAEATRIALARLKEAMEQADGLGQRDLPMLIALPSILLSPEAAENALPNLVTPFLDRRECARTVVLVDTVPTGGGQALRVLSDRGVHVAVTAAAAAGAEQADLFGWLRWGVVFPQHVIQGPAGIDGMTVQQTASAIATRGTRLIAVADGSVDPRELAAHNIGWTLSATERWPAAADALPAARTA